MPKRQPLTFNDKELTQDLKKSAARGVDAFFGSPPEASDSAKKTAPRAHQAQPKVSKSKKGASMPPAKQIKPKKARAKIDDSKTDSTQASVIASYNDSVIELVRKAVKDVGRQVSFVRLTEEEKKQLADIVYTYKRQGVKTSENEINRVAINHLIQDYQANGENSLLAKVIAALNA